MDPTKLQEFATRYTAAWCNRNAARVASFYAENGSLTINGATPSVGRVAITAAAQGFMTAFPDMVVKMDGVSLESGRAVYRWTLTGTNTGPGGTGKPIRISGYEEWMIGAAGLIAESRGHFDEAEYQRQLKSGAPAVSIRALYYIWILVPLVALAVVAALGLGERDLATGLGPGGTAHWLYPRSAVRDLVTYGGVAIWLLRELRRRTPAEFAPLLWRAPVIYAIANLLLPVPFVLVNGVAHRLFAEQGGWIAIRLVARLLIAYGYVALLVFIREQLRRGGALEPGD